VGPGASLRKRKRESPGCISRKETPPPPDARNPPGRQGGEGGGKVASYSDGPRGEESDLGKFVGHKREKDLPGGGGGGKGRSQKPREGERGKKRCVLTRWEGGKGKTLVRGLPGGL